MADVIGHKSRLNNTLCQCGPRMFTRRLIFYRRVFASSDSLPGSEIIEAELKCESLIGHDGWAFQKSNFIAFVSVWFDCQTEIRPVVGHFTNDYDTKPLSVCLPDNCTCRVMSLNCVLWDTQRSTRPKSVRTGALCVSSEILVIISTFGCECQIMYLLSITLIHEWMRRWMRDKEKETLNVSAESTRK